MTEAPTGDRHSRGSYDIRVQGHLHGRWGLWFDGMRLTHHSDGTTLIQGAVVDQAALHGLLQRIRDTGLPLVSVTTTEPDQPTGPTGPPPILDSSSTHEQE